MQALSRNTASVAQDFHNAGGVSSKKFNLVVNVNNNNNNSAINNNIFNTSTSIGNSMNNTKGENKKAMSDSPIESPPATSFDLKRRRKSLSNDKENENELLKRQIEFLKNQHELFLNTLCLNNINVVDKIKAEKEINDIFDKLYKNSISLFTSYQSTASVSKQEDPSDSPKKRLAEQSDAKSGNVNYEALPEFLRNNKEITIIVESKKSGMNLKREEDVAKIPTQNSIVERKDTEKSKRKQSMPRKIEKTMLQEEIGQDVKCSTTNLINKLRDKHMINLITKKKHCYLCKTTNYNNAFYTKTSLLLHKLWRHKNYYKKKYSCEKCQIRFDKTYKLILHQRLKKH